MTARARRRCSPLGIAVAHDEGRIGATVVRHEVVALARDAGDRRAEVKSGRDGRHAGEGLQILRHDLRAGRQVVPARSRDALIGEQGARGRVDIVVPGREDADMAPFEDRGADTAAFFEEGRAQAALDQTRGGGEADRTGSDHRDGEIFRFHHSILPEYSKL